MKNIINKLRSYFPTALPTGLSEFQTWADTICDLAGLPASRDSQHQALANMVLHISPKKGSDQPRSYVPMNWFVHALRKAAANQIASYVFQEFRKEVEKRAADELKLGEATASTDTGNGAAS